MEDSKESVMDFFLEFEDLCVLLGKYPEEKQLRDYFKSNLNKLILPRDSDNKTPLHIVCHRGHAKASQVVDTVLMVIKEDPSIAKHKFLNYLNSQDESKYTALHFAATVGNQLLLETLLIHGANPFLSNITGNIALHLACQFPHAKAKICAEKLLRKSSDGNKQFFVCNNDDLTPLDMAIMYGNEDIVQFYLSNINNFRASFRQYDSSGDTLLQSQNSTSQKLVLKNDDDAMHMACKFKRPKILKALLESQNWEIGQKDKINYTALHHAVREGAHLDGAICVKLILEKIRELKKDADALFGEPNDVTPSPFSLACNHCPPEIIRSFLTFFTNAELWLFPPAMYDVYAMSPVSMKSLLDDAFKAKHNDYLQKKTVSVDFSVIVGYYKGSESLPEQTKYLKLITSREFAGKEELLLHPLIQVFLLRKMAKLRLLLYSWIILKFLWTVAYSLVGLFYFCDLFQSLTVAWALVGYMMCYMMVTTVKELSQLCKARGKYFGSVVNLLQDLEIFIGLISVSPVVLAQEHIPYWQKLCICLGILMSWILSMHGLRMVSDKFGLVVEALSRVIFKIIQVQFYCFPLLCGFTVVFVILLDDLDETNTPVIGPLARVMVMMTGEYDFNGTFKEPNDNSRDDVFAKASKLLFFISFLVIISAGFFNLLTGFALDKVMELRNVAKFNTVVKRIDYCYMMETILVQVSNFWKYHVKRKQGQKSRDRDTESSGGQCINEKIRYFDVNLKDDVELRLIKSTSTWLKRLKAIVIYIIWGKQPVSQELSWEISQIVDRNQLNKRT